jgi:hypothetical protein
LDQKLILKKEAGMIRWLKGPFKQGDEQELTIELPETRKAD